MTNSDNSPKQWEKVSDGVVTTWISCAMKPLQESESLGELQDYISIALATAYAQGQAENKNRIVAQYNVQKDEKCTLQSAQVASKMSPIDILPSEAEFLIWCPKICFEDRMREVYQQLREYVAGKLK